MAYSNIRASNILSRTCGVVAIVSIPCRTRNQQNTHSIVVLSQVPQVLSCPHSVLLTKFIAIESLGTLAPPFSASSLLQLNWFIPLVYTYGFMQVLPGKSFHLTCILSRYAQFLPAPQSKLPGRAGLTHHPQVLTSHTLLKPTLSPYLSPNVQMIQILPKPMDIHPFIPQLLMTLSQSNVCAWSGIDLCTKSKTPYLPGVYLPRGTMSWKPSFPSFSPQALLFLKHFLTV